MRACDFVDVTGALDEAVVYAKIAGGKDIPELSQNWRGVMCIRCYQVVEHGFLMVHRDLVGPCGAP